MRDTQCLRIDEEDQEWVAGPNVDEGGGQTHFQNCPGERENIIKRTNVPPKLDFIYVAWKNYYMRSLNEAKPIKLTAEIIVPPCLDWSKRAAQNCITRRWVIFFLDEIFPWGSLVSLLVSAATPLRKQCALEEREKERRRYLRRQEKRMSGGSDYRPLCHFSFLIRCLNRLPLSCLHNFPQWQNDPEIKQFQFLQYDCIREKITSWTQSFTLFKFANHF